MTLEEHARQAFHAINAAEYKCSLAEAQVDKVQFEQVKKQYEVAEEAFVQGAKWHTNALLETACEQYCDKCMSLGGCDWSGVGECKQLTTLKQALQS